MPALCHYFLLGLLLFLLLAASGFGSPNDAVRILYALIILRRKSSLDLGEPLVERRFALPGDALVLVFVNHTRTYKCLLPGFIGLLPLSSRCVAILHVLPQEDSRWLVLVACLDA